MWYKNLPEEPFKYPSSRSEQMAHHDAGTHESATCCAAVINNNTDHVTEVCPASRSACDLMGASEAEG